MEWKGHYPLTSRIESKIRIWSMECGWNAYFKSTMQLAGATREGYVLYVRSLRERRTQVKKAVFPRIVWKDASVLTI
jgi:hypothetical protein